MGLTTITNGSLADATVVNNNFDYLYGRITDTAASIGTHDAQISSQIETLDSRLTSSISTINATITNQVSTINATMTNLMSSNGLYVTTSFNTSTGEWYREYFSNSSKTTRVFLEQGGTYEATSGDAAKNNYNLVFQKKFSNNKFHFQRSVQIVADTGDISNRYVMYNNKKYDYVEESPSLGIQSYVVLDIAPYTTSHYFTWYACGI